MPSTQHRPFVHLLSGLWRIECCTATRGTWEHTQSGAMTLATIHAWHENSILAAVQFMDAVADAADDLAESWAA